MRKRILVVATVLTGIFVALVFAPDSGPSRTASRRAGEEDSAPQEHGSSRVASESTGALSSAAPLRLRVRDSLGRPVIGAECRLTGTDTVAMTDGTGSARILVPPGTNRVQVHARCRGCFEARRSAEFRPNDLLEVRMERMPLLQVFNVAGERIENPEVVLPDGKPAPKPHHLPDLVRDRATVRGPGYAALPLGRLSAKLVSKIARREGSDARVFLVPIGGLSTARVRVQAGTGSAYVVVNQMIAGECLSQLQHLVADRPLPPEWRAFYSGPEGVAALSAAPGQVACDGIRQARKAFEADRPLLLLGATRCHVRCWQPGRYRMQRDVDLAGRGVQNVVLNPNPQVWIRKRVRIRDKFNRTPSRVDVEVTLPFTMRLRLTGLGELEVLLPPHEERYEIAARAPGLGSARIEFGAANADAPADLVFSGRQITLRFVGKDTNRAITGVIPTMGAIRGAPTEDGAFRFVGVPPHVQEVKIRFGSGRSVTSAVEVPRDEGPNVQRTIFIPDM